MSRAQQVRRAKLYYLRDRTGKAARLKELIVRKGKKTAAAAATAASGQ
jgi:large subunit ribosomal protein L19